jgi:hypothetical protein
MTAQPVEWYRFAMVLVMGFLSAVISEGCGIFLGTVFNPVVSMDDC